MSLAAAPDPVTQDSALAARWFGCGLLVLCLAAACGLTSWPGAPIGRALLQGGGVPLLVALHGYALTVVLMFFFSRPSPRVAALVVILWVPLSVLIWRSMGANLGVRLDTPDWARWTTFLSTTLALPALGGLLWTAWGPRPDRESPGGFLARLRWLVVLGCLFSLVPSSALGLTAALHPVTFDVYVLLWDRALGLNWAPELQSWFTRSPLLSHLMVLSYRLTPLAFLAVALLHLRRKPDGVPSGLLAWVLLTSGALLAYHVLPITGPTYAFGPDQFMRALDVAMVHPLQMVGVPPFPRNGMPSMHFGWMLAATFLWCLSGTRWWSRLVFIAMTTLTACATLCLGEHYLIDLVVAVPFVMAGLAAASTQVPWRGSGRATVVGLGVATWLLWVLAIRWGSQALLPSPGWLWCWPLLTLGVAVVQVRWLLRVKRLAAAGVAAQAEPGTTHPLDTARPLHRVGALFFASGFAALCYQVLFAKELALVFGSTATATFTVLATFLGGMAIGSLWGGWLARRPERALVNYALLEAGIALFCVATPAIFDGIQWVYVELAGGRPPDAPVLMALRVGLGALALLVPTIFMGATLPVLADAALGMGQRMGLVIGRLYFLNTAGAATGALVTAYWVIPALGGHRTTLVAAVINLMVALGALELAKTWGQRPSPGAGLSDVALSQPAVTAPTTRWLALATLGLGGLLSLGLEVVYVHLLSIVAGNSVYAFGLMVFGFLVGLSLGGELARRLLVKGFAPVDLLCVAFAGMALSISVGIAGWNAIPDYFASFAGYGQVTSFASREAVRGLVCLGLMVPPTCFIGAAYVAGMDLVTGSVPPQASGRWVGRAAALNTLGNILGVLVFGFWLVSSIGGLEASRWIAASALALSLLAAWVGAPSRRWRLVWAPGLGLLAWALVWPVRLDYDAMSTGANVYFRSQGFGRVTDHAESIDGGLTTVAEVQAPDGRTHRTLLTNGKFQGNDSVGGEMRAQVGFAMAPLLHQDRRDSALVIGYGTGVTTRAFHDAGFRQVTVAELSGDMIRMADQHFGKVNAGVSKRPGVSVRITDGRNLLLLDPRRHDVISIEITSIWFAGAASLYNRDFYQLAKRRLQTDGVLQQWMQLHRLSPLDLLTIVATLRAEFRFVSLYVMGGQGILVATDDPGRAQPSARAVERLTRERGLQPLLGVLGRQVGDAVQDRLLDPIAVDRLLADAGPPQAWWSTDDNMRLEYQTPRANVNPADASFQTNMRWLSRYAQPLLPR